MPTGTQPKPATVARPESNQSDATDPPLPVSITSRVTVEDLEGQLIDVCQWNSERIVVLFFIRTDCPIANRYAPEIKRLAASFADRNVVSALIYPDPREAVATIQQHRTDYGYAVPSFRDVKGTLTQAVGARVTPEAVLLDRQRQVVYRGRIDNWYADFGQARPKPTEHDLENAVNSLLAGQAIHPSETKAVGCYIPDVP